MLKSENYKVSVAITRGGTDNMKRKLIATLLVFTFITTSVTSAFGAEIGESTFARESESVSENSNASTEQDETTQNIQEENDAESVSENFEEKADAESVSENSEAVADEESVSEDIAEESVSSDDAEVSEGASVRIETEEDLVNFFANTSSGSGDYTYKSGNYILADNLDLKGIKLQRNWKTFNGTFDGNGKVIYDLELNCADRNKPASLFGDVTGSVSNLLVSGVIIDTTGIAEDNYDRCVGVIAGDVSGSVSKVCVTGNFTVNGTMSNNQKIELGGIARYNRGTISECSLEASIDNENIKEVAGIVNQNRGGTVVDCACGAEGSYYRISAKSVSGIADTSIYTSASIKNCVNYANLEATNGFVSGVCGTAEETQVEYCTNKGELKGNSAAGILGLVKEGTGIKNCVNSGDLYVLSGNCGGIFGEAEQDDYGTLATTIEKCTNEGTIYGESGSDAGGIGGRVESHYRICPDTFGSYKGVKISECTNAGDIITSDEKNKRGCSIIGGIIGWGQMCTIYKCSNIGKLDASNDSQSSVGGIIGSYSGDIRSDYASITECYNLGEIITVAYAGGLAGYVNRGAYISRCYNAGPISYSDMGTYQGDIGGLCYQLSFDLYNCTNSEEYSNGFGFVIKDCFNCGKITCSGNAGGLISDLHGVSYSDAETEDIPPLTITDCYNRGEIVGDSKYMGAIINNVFYCFNKVEIDGIYYPDNQTPQIRFINYERNPQFKNLTRVKGLTDEQFKRQNSYAGFDFGANTWKMGRKGYPYALLEGVGDEELMSGGAPEGTRYTQYVLKIEDSKSHKPIADAIITDASGKVRHTDKQGIVRITRANPALGKLKFQKNGYYDYEQEVTLSAGAMTVVPLKARVRVEYPSIDYSNMVDVKSVPAEFDGIPTYVLDFVRKTSVKLEFGKGSPYKIPIECKAEYNQIYGKYEVKITVGVEYSEEDDPNDSDNTNYYRTMEAVEKLRGGFSHPDAVTKDFEKGLIKGLANDCGYDSKMYALGYLDILLDDPEVTQAEQAEGEEAIESLEKLNYNPVTGGIIVGWEGSGEFTYYPTSCMGLIYGKLEGKFGAEGDVEISAKRHVSGLVADFTITLKEGVTVAIGAGRKKLHAEIGVAGTLKEKFNLVQSTKQDGDPLVITADLDPYGEVQVFVLKREYHLIPQDEYDINDPNKGRYEYRDMQLYPTEKKDTKTKSGLIEGQTDLVADEAADILGETALLQEQMMSTDMSKMELVPRDYSQAKGAVSNHFPMKDVYPYSEPQVASLSDGRTIYTFLADDPDKADASRTTLMYVIESANGVMSDAKPVSENAFGEFMPCLLAKGNNAWVAFLESDQDFGDTVTYEDLAAHQVLYVAPLQGDSFGTPIEIRKGDRAPLLFDLASDGTNLAVTWVENSENDIFLRAEGTQQNSIYQTVLKGNSVSAVETLYSGKGAVNSVDADYVNGKLTTAYIRADGNVADETTDIFLIDESGNTTKLGENKNVESYLSFLDGNLFYAKDSVIYVMDGVNPATAVSTGIQTGDEYIAVSGKDGRAIVFLRKNFGRGTILASYERDGAWTPATTLMEQEDADIYSFAIDGTVNGGFKVLYNDRSYDYDEDTGTFTYGKSNLSAKAVGNTQNLHVSETLSYDVTSLKTGNDVPFGVDVTNESSTDITKVKLELYVNGSKVEEDTVSTDLAPMTTRHLSLNYHVSGSENATYELKATTDEIQDSDLTDNTAKCVVAWTNLSLLADESNIAINPTTGKADISYTIKNDSKLQASDVKIQIQTDEKEEKIIDVGNVAAGASVKKNISVDIADFETLYDHNYVRAYAFCEQREKEYADNEAVVGLDLTTPKTISWNQSKVTLQAGESTDSTAVYVTTDVSAKYSDIDAGIVYTSSDVAVADVDKNGVVTGFSAGKANIIAYLPDGSKSASLEVTVQEAEPGAGETVVTYEFDEPIYEFDRSEGSRVAIPLYCDAEVLPDPTSFVLSVSDADGTRTITDGVKYNSDNDGYEIVFNVDKDYEAEITVKDGDGKALAKCTLICYHSDQIEYMSIEDGVFDMFCDSAKEKTLSTNLQEIDPTKVKITISDTDCVKSAVVDKTGKITIESGQKQGSCNVILEYIGKNATREGIKAEMVIYVKDPADYTYSLRFNPNGGVLENPDEGYQTLNAKEKFVIPKAAKAGSNLVGWCEDMDGKGTIFALTDSIESGVTFGGDTELYAIWEGTDALWMADIPDQTYTGGSVTPEVAVYHGNQKLIQGVDYTVKYKNNKDVSDVEAQKYASVTISGKGNYKGSYTRTFQILPESLSSSAVQVVPLVLKGTTAAQKKEPTVLYCGKALKKKKDYNVIWTDSSADAYKAPGEYGVTIEGIGNFTGSITSTITIYDKNGEKPTEKNLTALTKKNLKVVSGLENRFYTGKVIEPALNLQMINAGASPVDLTEGTDYIVVFQNNIKPGTASVQIVGIGKYTGAVKQKFTIGKCSIDKAAATVSSNVEKKAFYTAAGARPKVTLTHGDYVLVEGVDYKLSYDGNAKKPGSTAVVKITGKGNYTGVIEESYQVQKTDLASLYADIPDVAYKNKKGNFVIKPSIYDGSGKLLSSGKDYDSALNYRDSSGKALDPKKDIANIGDEITITIKAKATGNYTGELEKTYRVGKLSTKDLKITIPDQMYKGRPICPTIDQFVVYEGKSKKPLSKTAVQQRLKIVDNGYRNNTSKGKATVDVRGIGDYAGTVTVKFKIKEKDSSIFSNLF